MKKQSEKTLKKNENDWAIISIIENAKKQSSTIFAWNFITGKKVTVEVSFHILKTFKNEIVIRAVKNSEKRKLGNLVVAAQSLNFYLPDELVLFQTQIKELTSNGDVRVSIPEMIAQVDRRDSYRLLVENKKLHCSVKFKKNSHIFNRAFEQLFDKGLFDFSSGGISFLISRMEKDFFKMGDSISEMEVLFEDKSLSIGGQIVNIFEIQPYCAYNTNYKVWKVSVHLNKLSPDDKKIVEDFIFRHGDLDEAI